MIVYRLCKSKFSRDLSGDGARKTGGRWNSEGIPMVYTGESRALCTTEIAVHTGLGMVPADYCIVFVYIPDNSKMKALAVKDLPDDWKLFPHPGSTQAIGDAFSAMKEFLVLKVPSAVVQGDFNYLINPEHKDIKHVKVQLVEPFEFDERLFVR